VTRSPAPETPNLLPMTTNDNPAAPTPDQDPVEAIVRAAESALTVRRRYQFFVWTQSYLSRLIPHQLVVCGSYDRASRELLFDVFNSVSLQPALMEALGDARSLLMQHWQARWLEERGKPALIRTADLPFASLGPVRDALLAAQFQAVLVHGVSRPQRPQEIESFFVFAAQDGTALAALADRLELLLPHIHGAWQRVQAVERDVAGVGIPQQPAIRVGGVTQREREILSWLREGKSNQQIAEELGISALTVKNHVQKILRKLNASNRAQAVAQAMSLQLLERVATPPVSRVRLP
jgi:transcriptional regulator EpsA